MEQKDEDSAKILVESVEKTVRMVLDIQEKIEKMEKDVANLQNIVSDLAIKLDCVSIDSGAAHDLNDWMQDAKDDPTFEIPLDNAEIQRRTKEFYSKKANFGGKKDE